MSGGVRRGGVSILVLCDMEFDFGSIWFGGSVQCFWYQYFDMMSCGNSIFNTKALIFLIGPISVLI